MNIHALLSKQWTLPPFLPKRLLLSLLILLAPNAVFWVLALLTATARPIVNLDYLPAALLIALPWRFAKIAGVLAFWLAVLFDGLMMVIQLFPFMDLIGAINLVPFILTAPVLYQIMTGLLLLYMLAMPFVLQKAAAKTDFRHIAACAAVVAAAGYFTGHLNYYDRGRMANIFGANNFYYAKSQAMLYTVSQNADFITAGLVDPVFLPLGNQQRAATHLNEPKSQKILFIVAESWGLPANPELQNATFAKLLAQKDRFSVWESGSFPFIGATVEGEMRELCAYGGLRGFALRRAPDEKFARCLPNRLKQEGYATFAMHGAGSSLYDRFSWYPRAGFQEIKTAENLIGKKTCAIFSGVCDSELFGEVSAFFKKHDKGLFYWMTLTSHTDYPESDIFNHRLKCTEYGLPAETDLCRNFSLHTQFFDQLADLIRRPEMKGVEVIIVGDHPPPVGNLNETFRYLKQGHVAWLHFKIK